MKIQQNTPPRKNSQYSKWYPVTRYELLKMFSIIIAMELNEGPIYMIIGLWMFLIIPLDIMSNFRVIDLSYYILQCYTLTRLRRSNQQKIKLNHF